MESLGKELETAGVDEPYAKAGIKTALTEMIDEVFEEFKDIKKFNKFNVEFHDFVVKRVLASEELWKAEFKKYYGNRN